jgi:hypothetical protein
MIRWIGILLATISVASFAEDKPSSYILMQEDIAVLKHDFNEAVDQIRLVFIVGPT